MDRLIDRLSCKSLWDIQRSFMKKIFTKNIWTNINFYKARSDCLVVSVFQSFAAQENRILWKTCNIDQSVSTWNLSEVWVISTPDLYNCCMHQGKKVESTLRITECESLGLTDSQYSCSCLCCELIVNEVRTQAKLLALFRNPRLRQQENV